MQPIEFTGRYTSCKVFAESLEPTAEKQIQTFLECPAFEGSKIRIMPDVHAGAGAVIGFTATLTDKIVPNVIGVDETPSRTPSTLCAQSSLCTRSRPPERKA